ncbi:hypothetical protein SAMN04488065_2891 [Haloplanus vescus]|uniref:Uncharacterized protein n=1 Tax=Haloplanus vescus TaxID=555874 RepID=A0A1H4AQ49_9EURY|nr:glycosyltransferase [Haloplanus vescus]SEA38023.1 hypothetical protein SAMN04488065_2891 [Haloplanus vescus]
MDAPTVSILAPPEDHGGIGHYAAQLQARMADTIDATHIPLYAELGVTDYVRAALHATESDVVHIQFEYGFFRPKLLYAWIFFSALFLGARIRDVPVVVTVHEVWTPDVVGRVQYAYVWLVQLLLAITATRLVFMTEAAETDFRPRDVVADQRIPHGVDTDEVRDIEPEEARAAFGYNSDDTVISQIGYVSPRKGTEDFLRLAGRHPEYKFLLAGGPLRDEDKPYFQDAVEMAPANVHTTGVLSDEMFHAAFIATDVAVLAYHDIRQSGILNWCFAYGVPVVCRAIDRFQALSARGAPLVLFDESGHYPSIDEAVDTALAEATGRAESMRAFGAERDFSQVARQYIDLYQSLR